MTSSSFAVHAFLTPSGCLTISKEDLEDLQQKPCYPPQPTRATFTVQS